jgi:threonine dehydratase
MARLPTLKNVQVAARRLRPRIHNTPLLASRTLSAQAGVQVLFKCENLQRSGSFKYRGALNAVLSLDAQARTHGVVTHSSGNHGAALAAVAQTLRIPATIVVPRSASAFKRAAIRRYAGNIVNSGATLRSRQKTLAEVVVGSGAHFIPPYDHPHVIAGQGTACLEVLDVCPGVDEIWLPVGGGGLAAGTVLGAGAGVQVVGAEPELAADAYQSMQQHELQAPMPPVTVADGLRTGLGALNFKILDGYALPIKLVREDEILAAQQLAMSCLKILLEPSSAVPIAALLKYGPVNPATRCVVVIITGGNIEVRQSK